MGKAPSFRPSDLREQFGNIDIYLFDQLQKGRITPGMTVLDAGCGGGRNLVYLMRSGFTVFGVDGSADAIRAIRSLAAEVAPDLPPDNFKVAQVDALPFPDAEFNVVLCNAVLHFARDEAHFHSLLNEVWRVLAPRGLFFSRLASSIVRRRLATTPKNESHQTPHRAPGLRFHGSRANGQVVEIAQNVNASLEKG